MPKVRASSGMIGTQRGPMFLSFIRSLSSRTNAIVVATFCLPDPRLMSPNVAVGGICSGMWVVRRCGTEPPSASRRAMTYCASSDSSARGTGGRVEVEPVPDRLQVGQRQLLHLVSGVAAREARAEGPALDGLRQDDR